MGTAVPTEVSGRQHHQAITKMKAFVAVMALAGASATPAADPALLYAGHPAIGSVTPVVGTVDTGLKFHPASGAVTPDFTEAQKEAAPELAANQKAIKHLAYTGHVVQPVHPIHTTAYLYGKREAEAEPAAWGVYGYPGVYTGAYGYPYGGIHHVYGKRDAEAKSDAWGVYGYPGVYTGTYGYPYSGIHHVYGKRDAEADSYWVGGFIPTYAGYNRQIAHPYGHYLA